MNAGSVSNAMSASNYFQVKEEMQRDLIAIVEDGGSMNQKS